MRRLAILVLTGLAVVGVVACGGSPDTGDFKSEAEDVHRGRRRLAAQVGGLTFSDASARSRHRRTPARPTPAPATGSDGQTVHVHRRRSPVRTSSRSSASTPPPTRPRRQPRRAPATTADRLNDITRFEQRPGEEPLQHVDRGGVAAGIAGDRRQPRQARHHGVQQVLDRPQVDVGAQLAPFSRRGRPAGGRSSLLRRCSGRSRCVSSGWRWASPATPTTNAASAGSSRFNRPAASSTAAYWATSV